MLVDPIASIEDGLVCRFRSNACRTIFWVTKHENIGVMSNDLDRIVQGFPFLSRGRGGVGKSDDIATEADHGRFKRETGPRRRFEEARREYFPFEKLFGRFFL